jgi:ribulose-5-phosphate 4-epimerase/fuculose-1-phosphate aldolase
VASDGVIQFQLHHRAAPPPDAAATEVLSGLRDALHARGWIGRDPARYGGLGYGNVSRRLEADAFLVSATQTGHLSTLAALHWVTVTAASPATNELWSEGASKPSSESLTHAAIYQACVATFVCHIHHPALWNAVCFGAMALPMTPASATYGTPAMAAALSHISTTTNLPFAAAMSGHEDGLMAASDSPAELLELLDRLSAEAATAR